jgi:predicted transcriptional regulator of viral defense system
MGLREFFATHSVFTTAELAEYRNSSGSQNRWTRKALLAHHREQGRLVLIRRGLYAVVPPGADPETYEVDPYLVAAKLRDDAVLAYHTALDLRGKAYSVFNEVIFLTHAPPHQPTILRSHRFRGVLFPKALRDKGQEEHGVTAVDRSGVDIRVTRLERTLVDVLDRPELSGGWEEAWRSLESVEYFDLDKVVTYALLLGNATTTAKVGYFLDQHRERLMVTEAHLKPLKRHLPKQPHYLERSRRGKHRLVSDWNLVLPAHVAERSWEEAI